MKAAGRPRDQACEAERCERRLVEIANADGNVVDDCPLSPVIASKAKQSRNASAETVWMLRRKSSSQRRRLWLRQCLSRVRYAGAPDLTSL